MRLRRKTEPDVKTKLSMEVGIIAMSYGPWDVCESQPKNFTLRSACSGHLIRQSTRLIACPHWRL